MTPSRPVLGIFLAAATALAVAEDPGSPGGRWFDVRSFGAKGDGTTDDSEAVQAALDAARKAGGGVVFVPAGTYVVAPPGPGEGGVRLRSITIGSNVRLRGEGRASVLKVKSGVGSYRSLFSSHPTPASRVENVAISDLRIDQNCAASGGSVREGTDGHAFMILLAWGGRNIAVERVSFDPVCGVNTISLNAFDAEGLAVRDSHFRFARGPTAGPDGSYDNTAVYLHGRHTVATGNLFESTAADRARGAIELHGSDGVATGNVSRWYRSCVRVVGTSEPEEPPPPRNGFTVAGNLCAEANDAINVWSVSRHHVRGVRIAGNTVTLAQIDHQAHDGTLQAFAGISFVWDAVSGRLDGDVADVEIEDNTVVAQRARGAYRTRAPLASGGIALACAGNISNVVVRGNLVRDVPTMAIHLQAMGKGTRARNVRLEDNLVVNPGNERSAGPLRAGILLAGRLEDVEVVRNAVVGTVVPFPGQYAIQATAAAGSERVGIRDNAWDAGDPDSRYAVRLAGAGLTGGAPGGVEAVTLSPGGGTAVATLDASRARIWDVTIASPGDVTLEAPSGARPGQRLTVRLRNAGGDGAARIRWRGFKVGPWASPEPGRRRVVEVVWDGATWSEIFPSAQGNPE